MQKIKSFKIGGVLNLVKCSLIGIIATLIGTVVFAIVLKFADLSTTIINYINDVIKIFSIFIMIVCVKKNNNEMMFLKSIFAGIIYALLSYVVFSVLNGGFVMDLTFVSNLVFAVIVSAIVAVIVNVLTRKNV